MADFGLATDPDADRLAIVDEKGNPIGEEYTLAIAIDGFLQNSKNKNPVVWTNYSSFFVFSVSSSCLRPVRPNATTRVTTNFPSVLPGWTMVGILPTISQIVM